MVNKAKSQGTAYETAIVKRLVSQGFAARRLPEGGSLDTGDIEANMFGVDVVIEAKARQVLSVQEALAKARGKAGRHTVPVLFWKRLVPAGGSRRRPVAGEPEVVVMSPDDLHRLLKAAHDLGRYGYPLTD